MISERVRSTFCSAAHFTLIWGALARPLVAQSRFNCFQWRDLTLDKKVQVIGAVIRLAQERDKVTVRLSPEYYVRELDSLIARYVQTNDQKALKGSVGVTWKTIAVMEGDWDNGQDPLDCAQSIMGPALFDTFRSTYPNKYQHLLELHAQHQTNR